mgnify:CR=1 FL=1
MADLRSDDFSLTFDPLSLSFNAVLASTARMRREIGLGNQEVVDPAAFDQPALGLTDHGVMNGSVELYKACKQMQSVLGDFQDSVTSRDKLLELAESARRRGENTFGYGLLYQRERTIGLKALDDYAESFKDIKAAFKPLRKKLK